MSDGIMNDLDRINLKPGDVILLRDREDPDSGNLKRFIDSMNMAKSRMPILNDITFIAMPASIDVMTLARQDYPRDLAEKFDHYAVLGRQIARHQADGHPIPKDVLTRFNDLKTEVGHFDPSSRATDTPVQDCGETAHTS